MSAPYLSYFYMSAEYLARSLLKTLSPTPLTRSAILFES